MTKVKGSIPFLAMVSIYRAFSPSAARTPHIYDFFRRMTLHVLAPLFFPQSNFIFIMEVFQRVHLIKNVYLVQLEAHPVSVSGIKMSTWCSWKHVLFQYPGICHVTGNPWFNSKCEPTYSCHPGGGKNAFLFLSELRRWTFKIYLTCFLLTHVYVVQWCTSQSD